MTDNLKGGSEDLNLKGDLYRVRVKSTLKALEVMSFKDFLEAYIETGPKISIFDIFRNAVFDVVLGVEYGIKEEDKGLIDLMDVLIAKLEIENGEDSTLAKVFAKLLKKAKNLCEMGSSVLEIISTFEFMDISRVFNENFPATANKQNNEINKEFYDSITHYHTN